MLTSVQEICCPVGHICRESPTTNSGFICCKGDDKCETPVQAGCPPGTGPCTVEVGGGCCAPEDGCSPNGCLKFEPGHGPDDKNARAVTEIRVNPEDLPPAANEELDKVGVTDVRDLTGALTITPSNLPPAASKVLEDIGITEVKGGEIRVTATAIKEGEVQIDIGIGEDGVTGSVKKSSAEKAIAEWWTLEGDKTGLAVVLLLLVAGGMMFL